MMQDRKVRQDDKTRADPARAPLDAMRHSIRLRPSFVRLQRMAAMEQSGRYPSLSARPAPRPPSD
jgi:hypothetical protein